MKKTLVPAIWVGCAILLINSCSTIRHTHKPYNYSIRTQEYKTGYIKNTYELAKEQMPEAEIQLLKDSIKILFPKDILYKSHEIEPAETYKTPLNNLVKLLVNRTETDLLILGHCDSIGSPKFNQKLSNKRASFIKEYLYSIGMPNYRMETWGLSSSVAISDNTSEEGRQRNRRVEFVLLFADGLHWDQK